jgi:hypothetical protein
MGLLNIYVLFSRRQDSSIGFGAPVRANMRTGGSTNAEVTSVEKNLEYTTLNFSISQRRNSLKIGDTTKDFIKLKILQRKLSTFTNTQHSRLRLHIRLSLLNHSRLTLHIGLSLLD